MNGERGRTDKLFNKPIATTDQTGTSTSGEKGPIMRDFYTRRAKTYHTGSFISGDQMHIIQALL